MLTQGKEATIMPFRGADPIWIFLSAFAISSFGGIAAKLRGHEELTWRGVIGAFLYSGIIGLIVALAWYEYFDGKNNIPFLLAISGLAGIGGANVLDILKMFIKGKVNVSVEGVQDDDPGPGDEPDDN